MLVSHGNSWSGQHTASPTMLGYGLVDMVCLGMRRLHRESHQMLYTYYFMGYYFVSTFIYIVIRFSMHLLNFCANNRIIPIKISYTNIFCNNSSCFMMIRFQEQKFIFESLDAPYE